MNILELDSYNLADAVKFNKTLNPRIWEGDKMRPEVRAKLLEIAEDFKEFLGLSDIDVKDLTVSGSNANYSYTPYSDIDLHLVVDIPRADQNEVYRELFDAKKYQYNDLHNIKIGGYDVELYVENANKPPVSKGVYSVLNNDWINIPRKIRSEVNDDAVRSKYEDLKYRIDNAVSSNDAEAINVLAEKIKNMRQAGLAEHGELGPENLAYKMLRTQGKIKELYDARAAAKDAELSLKERRAPGSVFTYGFKRPAEEAKITVEDVGMTWDGVDPTTCMFLNEEDPEPSDEEILKDFIDFCFKELKIEQLPIIKLRRDPQWSVVNKTFGRYINEKQMLEVAWGQRHIMDILRTVAHELTHRHQHERDGSRMGPDAGETGSPWENEANARAGVLMRDYARLHPEFFAVGQAHNIKVDEGASGYIPTKAQAKDPRFSMALTVDIKPGQVGKEANKLKLRTDKQGHPQIAQANGLFEKLSLELAQFKEGRVPNRSLSQVPGEVEDDLGNQEATGPEFPPEWPEGTTKVDVSDLTDWYRLGMDISDMDDADPKDYNQGPPQTVVVFPSDEIEQGYLPQFKRLGLKTHDIDASQEHKPGKSIPKKKLAEEQLDEVRMAPSNLMQWAKSPEAQGIRAGFEAELIFRDTNNNGDDDYEMEPDYDMDERCRSIQQVVDFFNNGEYGGLSPRQERALQDGLDEQYFTWQDEKMYDAFRDEQEDLIKKVLVDENDWDLDDEIQKQLALIDDLTDDEMNAIIQAGEKAPKFNSSKEQILYAEANPLYEKYLDAQEEAEGLLDELVQDSIRAQDKFYDAALDDFRDGFYVDDDSGFFDDIGLRWMSDIAEGYDLDWPYMTGGGGNDGSRNWDSIGDSLHSAVDMPVKVSSGYHQAARKEGQFIVEPDSSLEPDDREDFGLEIVSPPMPLLTTLEKLQEVCDWANGDGDAYTNSSTGLHMGVSVPFKGGDVDYLKLILFLGDEYVLQSFGREANTYCKSAMSKFKENIRGGRADPMAVIKLMQSGLLELAHREIQKGVGDGKYTSVHIQKGYIEFRSPGGDWLAEEQADPEKLQTTMLRFARAMSLAANPAEERREYAKKLYKLVAPEGDSELALFSQFASGELTAEQLKKRWAEKTIGKEKKMNQRWKLFQFDQVADQWLPVPGAEWNGYTEDQVKNAVWSKYGREALDTGEYELRNMSEDQQWEVYDVNTGDVLEIIKGKNKGEVADKVYDKYVNQGIGFNVRPYQDPSTMTPRAKLAKRITEPKEKIDWDVIYKPTGRVIDNILRVDKEQAQKLLSQVAVLHDFKNANDLEIRPQQVVKDIKPDVAQNFTEPAPQNATDRVGSWAIYDVTLGREISRMNDVAWQQASDRADELERSTGHSMSVRGLTENFADGKGPGRPGDSQRHGIPKGATIAQLEKAAKAPGRKGQLARWQINMRRGKKK